MKHISTFYRRSFHHSSTSDSPPPTEKFLDKTAVTIEHSGRNVGVPSTDESWMDNLSAAEVVQQYGFDPHVILTSQGRLALPDGGDAKQVPSHESDDTSISDGDSSNSSEDSSSSADNRKLLNIKLNTEIRQRAQAQAGFST